MRLTIVLACLLIGALPLSADQWAKFLPEGVDPSTVQCKMAVVLETRVGENRGTEFWHADVSGKWKDGQLWNATAGKFEVSRKGRHHAEKVCSEVADEAERRMGHK